MRRWNVLTMTAVLSAALSFGWPGEAKADLNIPTPCEDNGDCVGSVWGPWCSASAGSCSACSDNVAACEVDGYVCFDDDQCAVPCEDSSVCPDAQPVCFPEQGRCGQAQCDDGVECLDGESCDEGLCVPTGTGPSDGTSGGGGSSGDTTGETAVGGSSTGGGSTGETEGPAASQDGGCHVGGGRSPASILPLLLLGVASVWPRRRTSVELAH